MNKIFSICYGVLAVSQVAMGQPADAPWPMARFDRWGTARQPIGPDPSAMRTPWLEMRLAPTHLVSHSPAIGANGTIFFGSWISNLLRKVDTNTGAVTGSFDALEWIKSSPAIGTDGTVYFNVPRTNGPVNGRIYAINPNTMDFDWFFTTNQSSQVDYDHCSPIMGPESNVLTGSTTGTVYRFLPNGSVVWDKPGLSAINFTLAMTRDDSKVIVPNGTKVTALNYTDGTVAWTFNTGTNVGCPGVAPNGTVVIGNDTGLVYGLNPDDGAVRWVAVTLDIVRGAPAFSDSSVYIGSFDKRLYSFRLSDGVREWSYVTSQQIMQGPIVGSDNRIYTNGRTGEITSVYPNGQLAWQIATNAGQRSSMSMDRQGRLYVPAASAGNGVMMISQAYFDATPITVNLVRGQAVSGGIPELTAIDQTYYRAKNGLAVGQFDPPIQIVMETTAPSTSIARMDVSVVAGASTPNLNQKIEAFDWTANAWVQLDSTAATLSDSRRDVTITTSPSKYVNASKNVRIRVTYIPTGLVAGSSWQARVDYAHFQFSPTFVP